MTKRKKLKIVLSVFVLASMACFLVICLPIIKFIFLINKSVPYRPQEFAAICDLIVRGGLKPNGEDVVTLNATSTHLTMNGKVYVTNLNNNLTIYFFPAWLGKADDAYGYIFCNRPLSLSDVVPQNKGIVGSTLGMYSPGPWEWKQMPGMRKFERTLVDFSIENDLAVVKSYHVYQVNRMD